MNLFLINEEIQKAIENSVDLETGEIIDLSVVDELQLKFDIKVQNIVSYIRFLEAKQNSIKIEKERIANLEKSNKKQIDNLKDYLLKGMQANKVEKLDFDTFSVGIRNNPPKMILDNKLPIEESIEDFESKLKLIKADFAAEKKSLKDALKRGEEVEGARLESSQSISIK